MAFTRTLAIELGPLGITVNNIPPGSVLNTKMSEENRHRFPIPVETLQAMNPVPAGFHPIVGIREVRLSRESPAGFTQDVFGTRKTSGDDIREGNYLTCLDGSSKVGQVFPDLKLPALFRGAVGHGFPRGACRSRRKGVMAEGRKPCRR